MGRDARQEKLCTTTRDEPAGIDSKLDESRIQEHNHLQAQILNKAKKPYAPINPAGPHSKRHEKSKSKSMVTIDYLTISANDITTYPAVLALRANELSHREKTGSAWESRDRTIPLVIVLVACQPPFNQVQYLYLRRNIDIARPITVSSRRLRKYIGVFR